MKNNLFVLFIIILFYSCNKEEAKKEVYPFQLIDNRVCVRINFNDSVSGLFLLDNEAQGSNYIDSLFLKKAGIKTDSQLLKLPFMICNKSFEEEFQKINVKIEPFVDGLIGQNIFLTNIVSLSFSDSTIAFNDTLPDIKGYYKMPYFKLREREYSEYGVKINGLYDINNNPFSSIFIVDLGNPMESEFTLPTFKKINTKLKVNLSYDTTRSRIGPHSDDILKNRVYTFGLDSLMYSNLFISINDCKTILLIDSEDDYYNFWSPAPFDGTLGIEFLKHFDVILDYKNGYLYLKPITKKHILHH
jgi:hypothetical protein